MTKEQHAKANETAQTSRDAFFCLHSIPMHLIESREFKEAVADTRKAPHFKACNRVTLRTTRLDMSTTSALSAAALTSQQTKKYGFIATGDGYAAKSKGPLHNFILITSQGPILRALKKLGKDDGKKAEDIKKDFEEWLTTEDAGVLLNTWLGITDTPSPNTKAWKLLMGVYPHQVWIGCKAHVAE